MDDEIFPKTLNVSILYIRVVWEVRCFGLDDDILGMIH